MATVVMPQLGESVTEGTILHWLKQPGDPVALDDSLCEIETEKVTAELPSQYEGTMGRLLVAEGETVTVGTPLCEVAESGSSSPPLQPPIATAAAPEAPAADTPVAAIDDDDLGLPAVTSGWSGGPMAIPPDDATLPAPTRAAAAPVRPAQPRPATAAASVGPDMSAFHSPVVARLAAEHGIDLSTIRGTGTGGRVTRQDILHAKESRPSLAAGVRDTSSPLGMVRTPAPTEGRDSLAPGAPQAPLPTTSSYEVVTLSPTRRTIAAHLVKSNLEAPQAWTMVEADVTRLVRRRDRDRGQFERTGVKLTLLPYFVQSVCAALREAPALNARWEGEELRRYSALNLGIAVAAEQGLVVPVIHDAQELSLEGLAAHIADLAERARTRKLRVADIEGGTFTVNNTGAFGSIASKPIVNHPEVGIVTMERAVQRAVVVEDAIAIRWMVNVCLSFDHRALDGLEAGRFLATLKAALEATA